MTVRNKILVLHRGLTSELLKHYSTFMLWFVLSFSIVISAIVFLTAWTDNNLQVTDPWRWYILFNYRLYFHLFIFMQILFICHINYLEHRNKTWKNIQVLPIPDWVIFISKFVFGYVILSISALLFYSLTMLGGHALGNVRPELGFQYTNYWWETFVPTLKFMIASSGVVSIMYWISYSVKSILVSVVIGLICYASAYALHLLGNRAGYDGFQYSRLHPFNFSGYAFNSFGTGNHSLNMEFVYYGVSTALFILILHYFISRRGNMS
ncbi:MAG TPA: ABC transporter permease [Chitinophagaceae bacterium]|jgi:hypothetical protein|nr:ABC transporter permease [Chitinophagaceae bacterium]